MRVRSLLTSWKFLAVAAVVVMVCLAIFMHLNAYNPDKILAEPRGTDGILSKDQVERLLADARADSRNARWRIPFLLMLKSPASLATADEASKTSLRRVNEALKNLLPDRNSYLKLAHEGSAASGQLLSIALDSNEPVTQRMIAINALSYVDPYRTVQSFRQPVVSGKATQVAWYLALLCLPRVITPPPWGNSSPTFASDLASKDQDTVFLERVDAEIAMALPSAGASMRMAAVDSTIIEWLNRYHGEDFDEWLSTNAPDVLAFRAREIKRGSDPVRLVGLLPPALDSSQITDEALVKKLYHNELDAKAMLRLYRICRDYGLGWDSDNWRHALTEWYHANRSRLVYDPKVMHFVVGPAPVRPEVSLESSDAGGPR